MINPPTAPLTVSARDALIGELKRHIDALANTAVDVRQANRHALLGLAVVSRLMADARVMDAYARYCTASGGFLTKLIKDVTGIEFTFTCDLRTDAEALRSTYMKYVFRNPSRARDFAMLMMEAILNSAYSTLDEEKARVVASEHSANTH